MVGKSRNVISNGSFYVNSLSFSIHQDKYVYALYSYTQTTQLQSKRQRPKSGQFLGKMAKKTLPFWAAHTRFRVQPKQTDSQINILLC